MTDAAAAPSDAAVDPASGDTAVDDQGPADPERARLLDDLGALLGDACVEGHVEPGAGVWIRVELSSWRDSLTALRDAGFRYFGFLSAIDWSDAPEGRYEDTEFDTDDTGAGTDGDGGDGEVGSTAAGDADTVRCAGGETRFQLLVQLHDHVARRAVMVKADLPGDAADELQAPSIADIYAGADWHEREAHEMFGIGFDGHANLAPIYLPTDFEGHPLRKDFPLLARTVKPWPGVVDIEEIPPELEAQLEAEVMAEFAASGSGA